MGCPKKEQEAAFGNSNMAERILIGQYLHISKSFDHQTIVPTKGRRDDKRTKLGSGYYVAKGSAEAPNITHYTMVWSPLDPKQNNTNLIMSCK